MLLFLLVLNAEALLIFSVIGLPNNQQYKNITVLVFWNVKLIVEEN